MLDDRETYKLEVINPVSGLLTELLQLICKDWRYSTKGERNYRLKFKLKTSCVGGGPKVHKSKQIVIAIKDQNLEYIVVKCLSDLKFRPITAGPCPTQSHLTDILPRPFISSVSSYIRDNLDF